MRSRIRGTASPLLLVLLPLLLASCGSPDPPSDADSLSEPIRIEPGTRSEEPAPEPSDGESAERADPPDEIEREDDDASGEECEASYPDFCIAPPPPDLDCKDVRGKKPFRVRRPDPHNFDRDGDGRACEPRRRG
jgi:hypothetical protein